MEYSVGTIYVRDNAWYRRENVVKMGIASYANFNSVHSLEKYQKIYHTYSYTWTGSKLSTSFPERKNSFNL